MEVLRKHPGKDSGLGLWKLWKHAARCAAYVLILALCLPAPASPEVSPETYSGGARPQALPELLFNQAAGLAGLPGLAQRPDAGQSLSGGPSEGGRRASVYMRFGVPSGYAPGLPGLDGEMRYDLRGHGDPTSGGRITAASGSSRDLSELDPLRLAQERALSYGLGLANSLGEAALSGLADNGRARLNFTLDRDGRFRGEGDVLLPLYDGQYTTLFTQIGARSMAVSGSEADGKDRWIGNFGLGQRWFPAAGDQGEAGDWMFGYNAFFDYDFTRAHQRGGLGAELQYDWLHLASNYYFPLSNWKGSYDFDSRLAEERPARGWDARVKAYLPFYRQVALTGAYTQWFGDHVGMFGADRLEQDPKVWSYGLEYTPVPLISAFLTQRSTEQGRTDTEFGLNFIYRFGMSWEEQIRTSKVEELRAASGARHEFVDRENRIILEYKARNAYRIEYLGSAGVNAFKFRLVDGFGKTAAGQSANVSLTNAFFAGALASSSFTTNGGGEFTIQLDTLSSTHVIATIQAGGNTQSFPLEVVATSSLTAVSSTVTNSGTVALIFDRGIAEASKTVDWSIVSGPGNFTGNTGDTTAASSTDGNGEAIMTLHGNAVGSGDIVVRATVDGKNYDVTVTIGVSYSLAAVSVSGGTGDFSSTTHTSAEFKVQLLRNGAVYTTSTAITWEVQGISNVTSPAILHTDARGLAWGTAMTAAPNTALTAADSSDTDGSGEAVISLSDVLGERTVTVRASVSINGQSLHVDQDIQFGAGPIKYFAAPQSGTYRWADNAPISNSGNSAVSNFPAAYICGTSLTAEQLRALSDDYYYADTNLPSLAQFQAIGGKGNDAMQAAGWSSFIHWTGQVAGSGNNALFAYWDSSGVFPVTSDYPAVVCLR